jgi:hypothetical protein
VHTEAGEPGFAQLSGVDFQAAQIEIVRIEPDLVDLPHVDFTDLYRHGIGLARGHEFKLEWQPGVPPARVVRAEVDRAVLVVIQACQLGRRMAFRLLVGRFGQLLRAFGDIVEIEGVCAERAAYR